MSSELLLRIPPTRTQIKRNPNVLWQLVSLLHEMEMGDQVWDCSPLYQLDRSSSRRQAGQGRVIPGVPSCNTVPDRFTPATLQL